MNICIMEEQWVKDMEGLLINIIIRIIISEDISIQGSIYALIKIFLKIKIVSKKVKISYVYKWFF